MANLNITDDDRAEAARVARAFVNNMIAASFACETLEQALRCFERARGASVFLAYLTGEPHEGKTVSRAEAQEGFALAWPDQIPPA